MEIPSMAHQGKATIERIVDCKVDPRLVYQKNDTLPLGLS